MLKVTFRITVFIVLAIIASLALAQRGCCSWHEGVGGCDKNLGRIICNDGTYSPTCMCFKSSNTGTLLGHSTIITSNKISQITINKKV